MEIKANEDEELEFNYWHEAFADGDIEHVENIPFLYPDDVDEENDVWTEDHDHESTDYSVNECISLQTTCLRKYSYENRFYFVTTFLLKEGALEELSIESLIEIDEDKLRMVRQTFRDKYHSIVWSGVGLCDIVDDCGNTVTAYLSAMESSFLYPMELCNTSLLTYWRCAYDFHTKKFTGTTLENRLVENRPLNCR